MSYRNEDSKKEAFLEMQRMVIQNNGLLVHRKAREAGIHPEYIQDFRFDNNMEEVMTGVYVLEEAFVDELFSLQQRYKRGIFSHETALSLWGMTDLILTEYVMTFPQGYNNKSVFDKGIRPKYSIKSRYNIGKTTVQTEFGNEVQVYNRERTLCDLLQKRHYTDKSVMLEAIKRYVASEENDFVKLIKYAKLFQVDTVIRPYIEILL